MLWTLWGLRRENVNQSLTCGLGPRREDVKIMQRQMKVGNERFEDKRQTGLLTKDPEEQRHLRNTLSNCVHRKVKL